MTGFPDVEAVVLDLCVDLFASTRVGTETPADLQTRMPFLRVQRTGGPNDRFNDTPRVQVDVFTATRAQGLTLSEQIRQRLNEDYAATETAGIDRADTVSGPMQLPWADPKTRRTTAAYLLILRR